MTLICDESGFAIGETMTAPELKPCPFCGARDVFVERRTDGYSWEVTCDAAECSVAGPVRATKREAIAAWNTRVDAEASD